ncbi:MAG: CRISPR-associated protein Csx19 [Planctomycetaceae bacterium]
MTDSKPHLLIYEHQSISRGEVLELGARLREPVALTYSPRECRFARWTGNHWATWSENKEAEIKYDFPGVYELRLFSKEGEFRWLNNPATRGNRGAASLVTDSQADSSIAPAEGAGWECATNEPCTDRLENQYLLWGEGFADGISPEHHWSCLATGRIGKLYVPITGVSCMGDDSMSNGQGRVILKSYEYIGIEDGLAGDHGNCAIVAERLSHLELNSGVVMADPHLLLAGQE